MTLGARPSEGSSSSRMRGRAISAAARSPASAARRPTAGRRAGAAARAGAESAAASLRRAHRRSSGCRKAPRRMLSSTLSSGNTWRPSGTSTMPCATTCSARRAARVRAPSKWMPPRTGRCSPASARISVDLPAPLAPSSATASPSPHLQVDAVQHRLGAVAGDQRADAEHLRRPVRAATRAAPPSRSAALRRGRPGARPGRPASRPACRRRCAGRRRAPRPGRRCPSPAPCRARPAARSTPASAMRRSSVRQPLPCRRATGRPPARRAAARRDRSPARGRSRPAAGRRAAGRRPACSARPA